MKHNLKAEEISGKFREALLKGFFSEPLTVFIDLEMIGERISLLKNIFPENAVHAIAMKANPLEKILMMLNNAGVAAEVASSGELLMAENAGFSPERIIYDSPVKTYEELEYAVRKGIHINIDSLQELERIKKIRETVPAPGTFGLRINPQTGTGTIATSSVAGEYSKFGVPVKSRRKDIIKAFHENSWLTGVHLHIGSQGCAPAMLIQGAEILFDLVKEVNNRDQSSRQIRIFDIGGGFPVSYNSETSAPAIEEYVNGLKLNIPELFSGEFTLITEFGRWVHVNSGWTVSRVEYLKDDDGIKTAMIHAGADMFLRECLLPADWKHEYSVLDRHGNLKHGKKHTYNIAGPLCFSGDIPAKNVILPETAEGDYIVIHDTGGYTFSMWSRYNSRFIPRITGYRKNDFEIIKEREKESDLLRFWK